MSISLRHITLAYGRRTLLEEGVYLLLSGEGVLNNLSGYLAAGGMTCPGDKELTPFTPEKTSRIKVLVKRFETAAAH